jgi:hypothetical protein
VGWCKHHVTRHNTPIHNVLSAAPQLRIFQKTLGTIPENGNVMPKHVEVTIHKLGHAVAQWLRHCARNRKVAKSIPDDVIGILC